jgi:hypothetical protein
LIKLACAELLLEGGGLFSHIDYGKVSWFFIELFADFLAEKDGI